MEKVFPIMIFLVIVMNGLWYWIKFTLKENGYPVSWFWNHFADIPNMFKLAKRTEEPNKKIKYYLMASGLPIGVILTFIIFFTIVPSAMQGNPCEFQERFRHTEWEGIVIKKYRDKPNHNYQTIEIQNDFGVKTIQNWVLFSKGNFERIDVGDSIVKKNGNIYISLFKTKEEINLLVDYGCDE